MTFKQWSLAVPLVSFTLVASTCVAQAPPKDETPPPVGERVGGKVDSAVESIKKGVNSAGEAIRDQWEKARISVHNMGVSARVYGRLHWDKALYNAKVDVEVQKDGVAVLTGTVGDPLARAKAVELTRDTVGVSKVVDRLTVLTTTTGATPAPGTPAKP
jgi:hyperosmotically inducible protein